MPMIIDEENLEEVINEAVREEEEKNPRKKNKLWVRLLVALLAAAAVVAGYFIVQELRLAENGYDAASRLMQGTLLLDSPNPEVNADDPAAMLSQAEMLIREGSYSRAEDILDRADTKIATDLNNLQDDGLDLLPESELNSQRNKLVTLRDNARWYRALLCLKAKKPRKAGRILKEIASSESVRSGKADALLDEIWGTDRQNSEL